MDIEKLNYIRKDILSCPLPHQAESNSFCFVYVDGTSNLTFEECNATLHSARLYSAFNYTIYLYVSVLNDKLEIDKIVEKYPNTIVYFINPLENSFHYNEWYFNTLFPSLPDYAERVFSIQSDGLLLKSGWENFVRDDSYIGAPWRAEIEIMTNEGSFKSKNRVGNGGMAYKRRSKMLKVLDYVNARGGQHNYFRGIKINGKLMQNNSWLAEDAMFSLGFEIGIFKLVSEEKAREFAHEPLELETYISKINLPYCFHKIDN